MKRLSGTGAARWLPLAAWYASSVSDGFGAAICVAVQLERRSMPTGMWCSQKDMGSPNTPTSKPLTVPKCAAAASPYGPAPTIITSYVVIDASFQDLRESGRAGVPSLAGVTIEHLSG